MKKKEQILSIAVSVCAGLLADVAWHDMHHFVIRHYELRSEKLARDARLVVLADLHDHVYGRHNEPILKAIDKLKPDLVLSAGDLITAHHDPSAVRGEEATALLMTLAKRYPTIAINGNHETKIDTFRDLYGDRYDDLESSVHGAGGVILKNERVKIPDLGICVTGLELPLRYFKHFKKELLTRQMLTERLGVPDADYLNVLLAHHPDYFPEYRAWGADLVLAGHIHGGIVRLPHLGGLVSPRAILFPRYDGGEFTDGDATMILSRGLGTHTIPLRLFNPGELVVVDLKRI